MKIRTAMVLLVFLSVLATKCAQGQRYHLNYYQQPRYRVVMMHPPQPRIIYNTPWTPTVYNTSYYRYPQQQFMYGGDVWGQPRGLLYDAWGSQYQPVCDVWGYNSYQYQYHPTLIGQLLRGLFTPRYQQHHYWR